MKPSEIVAQIPKSTKSSLSHTVACIDANVLPARDRATRWSRLSMESTRGGSRSKDRRRAASGGHVAGCAGCGSKFH